MVTFLEEKASEDKMRGGHAGGFLVLKSARHRGQAAEGRVKRLL